MKNTYRKIFSSSFISVVLLVVLFFAIPVYAANPVNPVNGGIVPCGVSGQRMCTLCDMISGMNVVVQYVMKIAIGLGILAFTIGGVMYAISAGDSGMIDTAKGTMKDAAIGFLVIFSAWLIVNTTIDYIGTRKSTDKGGTLGINVTSWGQFECNRREPTTTQSTTSPDGITTNGRGASGSN